MVDPIFYVIMVSVAVGIGFLILVLTFLRLCADIKQASNCRDMLQEYREFTRWQKNYMKTSEDVYATKPFVNNVYRILNRKITAGDEHFIELLKMLREAGEGKLEPANMVKRIDKLHLLDIEGAENILDDEETPL